MSAPRPTELSQTLAKALAKGFGKVLADAREKRVLSLRQAAKLLGVSHVFLRDVEQGRRKPSNALLLIMAHVFGLDHELVRQIGELDGIESESIVTTQPSDESPSPSTFARMTLKSSSGEKAYTFPLDRDTTPKIGQYTEPAPGDCNVKLSPGLRAVMSKTMHVASGQTAAISLPALTPQSLATAAPTTKPSTSSAKPAPHLATYAGVRGFDNHLLGLTILRALSRAGFRARLTGDDGSTTSEPGDPPAIRIDLAPGLEADVRVNVRRTT